MLLAAVLPAGEDEAAAADVMRCSIGKYLCGATRPADQVILVSAVHYQEWLLDITQASSSSQPTKELRHLRLLLCQMLRTIDVCG